ncbi:hypothetical protein [Flavobacterium sandaracinum]|nr:hypothetical protein [Flavobacterium sandaracinum]
MNSLESTTSSVDVESISDCTVIHLRWNDVSSDGEGGDSYISPRRY